MEALTIKLLIFLRDDGSATWADFTEAEAPALDAWACGATVLEVLLFAVLLLEGTALEGTTLSATGAAILAAEVFPLRSTLIPKTMTISKAKMVKTTVADRSRFGVRVDDSSQTGWGISSERSLPALTNASGVGGFDGGGAIIDDAEAKTAGGVSARNSNGGGVEIGGALTSLSNIESIGEEWEGASPKSATAGKRLAVSAGGKAPTFGRETSAAGSATEAIGLKSLASSGAKSAAEVFRLRTNSSVEERSPSRAITLAVKRSPKAASTRNSKSAMLAGIESGVTISTE
jgi:hypothetical protein